MPVVPHHNSLKHVHAPKELLKYTSRSTISTIYKPQQNHVKSKSKKNFWKWISHLFKISNWSNSNSFSLHSDMLTKSDSDQSHKYTNCQGIYAYTANSGKGKSFIVVTIASHVTVFNCMLWKAMKEKEKLLRNFTHQNSTHSWKFEHQKLKNLSTEHAPTNEIAESQEESHNPTSATK